MQLTELIDRAAKETGSDYKLAKTIGVSRQKVSNWRTGAAGCGIEYRALMAAIARVDVDEVIREALIEKNANTPLGERLMSALGNVLHGAVAITLTFVSAAFFVTPGRVEAMPTRKPAADNV